MKKQRHEAPGFWRKGSHDESDSEREELGLYRPRQDISSESDHSRGQDQRGAVMPPMMISDD